MVGGPAARHKIAAVPLLIAGNWKMYKTAQESISFCAELRERLRAVRDVEVVVCPPYTSLDEAVRVLAGSGIAVFAQNAHWEREGAFTGEVSPPMLAEIGVTGSLVAHSERRQLFAETNESAARRIGGVLDAGLRVIACVGETEVEREAGETEAVLHRQVEAIRDAVEPDDLERLTIAYEPVWAIGTGRTATPEQAEEAHALVRGLLDVPILYGGSVKPENARELLAQPDVDGALVGGASLDVESFAAICEAAAALTSS
jgi:triosephosphate isomerase